MGTFKNKNCNLHYEKEGTGDVLIFLHGLSDNLKYWNPLKNYFKKEYTVISIDFRGHGESEYTKGGINNYILQDDIYQLLKYLNIKKASLIGFSLGGTVSMNFALNHPEMVEKLVLISTFAKIDENYKKIHKKLYNKVNEGLDKFYDMMIPLVLPENIIKENPELIAHGREKCLEKNQKAIGETIQSYYKLDIEDEIKNIEKPTLIIGGSDDSVLAPYNMIIRLFEEIKDSEIIFLKNTKHNVLLNENIEKIYLWISEFLKE